jgi:hypothetical protein
VSKPADLAGKTEAAETPASVERDEQTRRTALPDDWEQLWGHPSQDPARIDWARLRKRSREAAEEIVLRDEKETFGALVGSGELREQPVHRWFSYKEGFSPELLATVIEALELDDDLCVVDAFGGVGTTAVSGLLHPKVQQVRSVEYSPFARFVGQTKLQWPDLDPVALRKLMVRALAYDTGRKVSVPELAAFHNRKIFSPQRIRELLRARDHIRELPGVDQPERDFFLLGLAAVAEDLSGATKDGRALRIKGHRKRRASSLAATPPELKAHGTVARALAGQWTAMLADLDTLASRHGETDGKLVLHMPGDARDLSQVHLDDDEQALPDGWADLALFSPPYMNCIDYTEVYKIELWLLEHICSQKQFRETRLGTLRSHPSVRFKERDYFDGVDGVAVELVEHIADWMGEHGGRPEVAPVVRQYFEDMLQVWREQHRILRSRASAVCVVANSTFSRRGVNEHGERHELWRVPLLTDVLLAHLALTAGFESVEIWEARELRPRNVQGGKARESLVVAHKR